MKRWKSRENIDSHPKDLRAFLHLFFLFSFSWSVTSSNPWNYLNPNKYASKCSKLVGCQLATAHSYHPKVLSNESWWCLYGVIRVNFLTENLRPGWSSILPCSTCTFWFSFYLFTYKYQKVNQKKHYFLLIPQPRNDKRNLAEPRSNLHKPLSLSNLNHP